MKAESHEVVTPSPYFKIAFGCSNRAFFEVKSDVYAIGGKIGIEIEDGYIDEKCDYEGDLEKIIIYNNERGRLLVDAVMAFYDAPIKDIEGDMYLVLSIS